MNAEHKETATITPNGRVLSVECEGVSMPADYSFAAVNDWVHSVDRHFEELQWHALGAASEHDNLKLENERLKQEITSLSAGKFFVFERLQERLEVGCHISFQDEVWNLFDASGELVCCGDTVRQMLINLVFTDC